MKGRNRFHTYLERYPRPDFIPDLPHLPFDIIAVIPCCNEDALEKSLASLYDAAPGTVRVLILVVVNHSEDAPPAIVETNMRTIRQIQAFSSKVKGIPAIHTIGIPAFNLPKKHAGVGLARKIGMDEAVRLFHAQNTDGVILCFDADSRCRPNLFQEVASAFERRPSLDGVSIYFEHPLEGTEFQSNIYEAIILYEVHLRYHIQMQKMIRLPFAFQTVGSSMAVRASSYAKFGGMNKRQAGEDFYFLQKFIKDGRVMELNSTTIIPSPRTSDRVPFGTGKAVGDITSSQRIELTTYHPNSYLALQDFVTSLSSMYMTKKMTKGLPASASEYFEKIRFAEKFEDSLVHTSSFESFSARIFRHFDAFQLMKYLHFSRDFYHANIPVSDAVRLGLNIGGTPLEQLKALRLRDKQSPGA